MSVLLFSLILACYSQNQDFNILNLCDYFHLEKLFPVTDLKF